MAPPLPAHTAAVRIQSRQRGRSARARANLYYLAFRIQKHFKSAAEQQSEIFDAEQHSAPLMHGAVMRLEGRLLKQSGLGWQQRQAQVDSFRFRYLSRHGDSKSLDLVEVESVAIVSEDRLEFVLHMRGRSGKSRTFRALNKQEFKSWTLGLQQYVRLAQAYYAM